MTNPPCGRGGIDCERRHVGCREECAEWKEWLNIHAVELTKQKNARSQDRMINEVMMLQSKRKRAKTLEEYNRRYYADRHNGSYRG